MALRRPQFEFRVPRRPDLQQRIVAAIVELHAGDRLVLVTDGVTEAENATGEFFDNHRLEKVAAASGSLVQILAAVSTFCDGTPLNDDCTVVDLIYSGEDE